MTAEPDPITLRFTPEESALFLSLLETDPPASTNPQPLSRSSRIADHELNQEMLEDALKGFRKENRRRLRDFLADADRCRKTDDGLVLRLKPADIEWLLQVLNDIRIASWTRLGSPEDDMTKFALDPETAPHLWAIEIAFSFQVVLLDAIKGKEPR